MRMMHVVSAIQTESIAPMFVVKDGHFHIRLCVVKSSGVMALNTVLFFLCHFVLWMALIFDELQLHLKVTKKLTINRIKMHNKFTGSWDQWVCFLYYSYFSTWNPRDQYEQSYLIAFNLFICKKIPHRFIINYDS